MALREMRCAAAPVPQQVFGHSRPNTHTGKGRRKAVCSCQACVEHCSLGGHGAPSHARLALLCDGAGASAPGSCPPSDSCSSPTAFHTHFWFPNMRWRNVPVLLAVSPSMFSVGNLGAAGKAAGVSGPGSSQPELGVQQRLRAQLATASGRSTCSSPTARTRARAHQPLHARDRQPPTGGVCQV